MRTSLQPQSGRRQDGPLALTPRQPPPALQPYWSGPAMARKVIPCDKEEVTSGARLGSTMHRSMPPSSLLFPTYLQAATSHHGTAAARLSRLPARPRPTRAALAPPRQLVPAQRRSAPLPPVVRPARTGTPMLPLPWSNCSGTWSSGCHQQTFWRCPAAGATW